MSLKFNTNIISNTVGNKKYHDLQKTQKKNAKSNQSEMWRCFQNMDKYIKHLNVQKRLKHI